MKPKLKNTKTAYMEDPARRKRQKNVCINQTTKHTLKKGDAHCGTLPILKFMETVQGCFANARKSQ